MVIARIYDRDHAGLSEEELAALRLDAGARKVEGACWVWTRYCTPDGYGRVKYKKKPRQAHRVSWVLANGQIPKGLCVLHRCDNPPCVNPDHLFLGTQDDNMKDAKKKGRIVVPGMKGENHANSKLKDSDVIEIRERRAKYGTTYRELAYEYGVTYSAIQCLVSRSTWKHLP